MTNNKRTGMRSRRRWWWRLVQGSRRLHGRPNHDLLVVVRFHGDDGVQPGAVGRLSCQGLLCEARNEPGRWLFGGALGRNAEPISVRQKNSIHVWQLHRLLHCLVDRLLHLLMMRQNRTDSGFCRWTRNREIKFNDADNRALLCAALTASSSDTFE